LNCARKIKKRNNLKIAKLLNNEDKKKERKRQQQLKVPTEQCKSQTKKTTQ